jgi:hypothetical protein
LYFLYFFLQQRDRTQVSCRSRRDCTIRAPLQSRKKIEAYIVLLEVLLGGQLAVDLDAVNLAVAVPRNRERLEHVQSTWALTHRRQRRLVDHRKDTDAAVIQCVLHRVLAGVLAKCVHQTNMDPELVLLVLIIAVRAGVTPVVNLGLVPANTVAIRAVVRAKRDNVHREVLPDALTQGQVGHGPVVQGISLDILLDQGSNRLLVGLVRLDQAVLEILIILDVAPELVLELPQVEDIIKHDRHFWKGKERN